MQMHRRHSERRHSGAATSGAHLSVLKFEIIDGTFDPEYKYCIAQDTYAVAGFVKRIHPENVKESVKLLHGEWRRCSCRNGRFWRCPQLDKDYFIYVDCIQRNVLNGLHDSRLSSLT
jgi:hypothetical protein